MFSRKPIFGYIGYIGYIGMALEAFAIAGRSIVVQTLVMLAARFV